MKRIFRWAGRTVIGLVLVALLGAGVLYVLSERALGRSFDAEGRVVDLPTDPAAIEEGRRLAILRGCYDGCHGPGFGGSAFLEESFPFNILLGRLVAPDLTRLAAERSDAELERSIRQGVRADGRSVIAMPSESFAFLSDEDLGSILAALRAGEPAGGPGSYRRLGPMARYFIVRGDLEIAATQIDPVATPPARTPTDPFERGEYLARTICAECHGRDLRGSPAFGPSPMFPPLSVVTGYSYVQFTRLLREGVPASEIELGLMRQVALERFGHLTEGEVGSLYAYLNRRDSWEGGTGADP